jgi:hypothetical protein
MFLIALLCFAIAFYLLLVGFYSVASYVVVALCIGDQYKPSKFKFTVSPRFVYGPVFFALAGAVLIYLGR